MTLREDPSSPHQPAPRDEVRDTEGKEARPGPRAWLYARWRRERERAESAERRAAGAEQRADELKGLAAWAQAELENLRKQGERERAAAAERAAHGVVAGLLPVLDALDQAFGASGAAGAPGTARAPAPTDGEGLALLRKELDKALAAQGLEVMEAQGLPFDPGRHEAVLRDERPCRNGEAPGLFVAQVLRNGYTLRGKVLRTAMVRVEERIPAAVAPAGHTEPPQQQPQQHPGPGEDPARAASQAEARQQQHQQRQQQQRQQQQGP